MSEATDSSTRRVYVRLLGEGTDAWRPAVGMFTYDDESICELCDEGYDEELEQWEFPPGSKVRCEMQLRGGERYWVAVSAVP